MPVVYYNFRMYHICGLGANAIFEFGVNERTPFSALLIIFCNKKQEIGRAFVFQTSSISFSDRVIFGQISSAVLRKIKLLAYSGVGDSSAIWELCYRRTSHGANSAAFHNRCDGRGPTVTIARLGNGRLIGGYAGHSWNTSTYYFGDSSSFLFSLTTNHRHSHYQNSYHLYGHLFFKKKPV